MLLIIFGYHYNYSNHYPINTSVTSFVPFKRIIYWTFTQFAYTQSKSEKALEKPCNGIFFNPQLLTFHFCT